MIKDPTSKHTAVNSTRVPRLFTHVDWVPGTLNLDLGSGPWPGIVYDYLEARSTHAWAWDPYWLPPAAAAGMLRLAYEWEPDTITVSNVLNVIRAWSSRDDLIKLAAALLRGDGTAYFTVYERNRSGIGEWTSKGWQENRRTQSYVPEIQKYFRDVVIRKGVIHAKNPIGRS